MKNIFLSLFATLSCLIIDKIDAYKTSYGLYLIGIYVYRANWYLNSNFQVQKKINGTQKNS